MGENEAFRFPDPSAAASDRPLCAGGNLSPGMLLSAYAQGVFPWFSPDDPILWWNPDPRFILLPTELHISGTMRKILKKNPFSLRLDTAFAEVIHACAAVPRAGQSGTWITDDIMEAYIIMHGLGYAHSVEAWKDDSLVGGLYGISLGSAFFGESMFSIEPNASKAAFIPLVLCLADRGFSLVDSQVRTRHVASLGGKEVPRSEYLSRLARAMDNPTLKGSWDTLIPEFPDSTGYRALLGQT
ncbi:MAG: leucyl/phenylalanyl-tRNA--protein transferase [Spirochaetales bacterium]|nr:MAG: leucyl/phenylalanyl-tRNA--protein transferase [Spirochaetales bacterium]